MDIIPPRTAPKRIELVPLIDDKKLFSPVLIAPTTGLTAIITTPIIKYHKLGIVKLVLTLLMHLVIYQTVFLIKP